MSRPLASDPFASNDTDKPCVALFVMLCDMGDTNVCCDFGGTLCVKYSDISGRMISHKVALAMQSGADCLAGGENIDLSNQDAVTVASALAKVSWPEHYQYGPAIGIEKVSIHTVYRSRCCNRKHRDCQWRADDGNWYPRSSSHARHAVAGIVLP